MIDRIDEVQMVIPPDSAWKYSNMAYGFLGEVISRLSGQPYEQFVEKEILDRLGMMQTVFDMASVVGLHRVTGYSQPAPGSETLRVAPYSELEGMRRRRSDDDQRRGSDKVVGTHHANRR